MLTNILKSRLKADLGFEESTSTVVAAYNAVKSGLMGRQVDSQVATRTPVFTHERGALYVGIKTMLSFLLYLSACVRVKFDSTASILFALPHGTFNRMDECRHIGDNNSGHCVFLSPPRFNESSHPHGIVCVCGSVCTLHSRHSV